MTLQWCELQWKHASSVGWQITRPLADNVNTHVRWPWQPFNLRFTSPFWKLVASKKQGFSFFLLLCRALACSVSCLNAMSCSQHRWHERHTELWRKTQGAPTWGLAGWHYGGTNWMFTLPRSSTAATCFLSSQTLGFIYFILFWLRLFLLQTSQSGG